MLKMTFTTGEKDKSRPRLQQEYVVSDPKLPLSGCCSTGYKAYFEASEFNTHLWQPIPCTRAAILTADTSTEGQWHVKLTDITGNGRADYIWVDGMHFLPLLPSCVTLESYFMIEDKSGW